MFYPRVRPPFASRPPSTGSAICCEQIATHERTSTHSVQNSPTRPPPAAHPVQNSPSAPVLQRFREKVRPVHPTPQQNREKVRPAHLKTAFFASFAPAGRIFSRSHPHQTEQGELLRAPDPAHGDIETYDTSATADAGQHDPPTGTSEQRRQGFQRTEPPDLRGLARQRVDAPSEARSADGERAGRRPQVHTAARPHKAHAAPGTPAAPQAPPQETESLTAPRMP